MGSDESQFNVSLIVRDKVTRPCPQTTAFEEKGEPKRYRTDPCQEHNHCLTSPSGSVDRGRDSHKFPPAAKTTISLYIYAYKEIIYSLYSYMHIKHCLRRCCAARCRSEPQSVPQIKCAFLLRNPVYVFWTTRVSWNLPRDVILYLAAWIESVSGIATKENCELLLDSTVVGLNLFNTELSTKRYWRGPRSQKGGGVGVGVGVGELYLTLHCHHHNYVHWDEQRWQWF